MKINKQTLRTAYNRSFASVVTFLQDSGVTVVDGALVSAGMLVNAVGLKGHKQYTIAPKGADPASRRVPGAISVYHVGTGKLSFVRNPQRTLNDGTPAGLFTLDGTPVIGYAD